MCTQDTVIYNKLSPMAFIRIIYGEVDTAFFNFVRPLIFTQIEN
jgi:hypothetical protein